MTTKELTLTVKLTFSGKGIIDREAVINNIVDAIKSQADHAGVVADDETEFTETVDVRDEKGHGITLDITTGETI